MAKAFKCDRCREYYEDYPRIVGEIDGFGKVVKKRELCKSCSKAFDLFMGNEAVGSSKTDNRVVENGNNQYHKEDI